MLSLVETPAALTSVDMELVLLQVVTEKLDEVKSLIKELGIIGKTFIPALMCLLCPLYTVCHVIYKLWIDIFLY